MSNKSISVYAEAMKRSKEEQKQPLPEPSKKKKPSAKKKRKIKKSRNQDFNQDFKISRFLDFATPLLDEKPSYMQSFNYPPFVIEELDKLVLDLKAKGHKIKKRSRWSTTKTTVFIMAILFLLWDYKEFKEDSILHKAIFEAK